MSNAEPIVGWTRLVRLTPPPPQMAKTKREVHLETLLTMALPYIERDELSTNTSGYTRHLIAEIKGQFEKGKTWK